MSKMVWWVGAIATATSACIIMLPGVVSPPTYLFVLAAATALFMLTVLRRRPTASLWLVFVPAVLFVAWTAGNKVMSAGVVTSNITEVGALMLAIGLTAAIDEFSSEPAVSAGPPPQRRGDEGRN